MALKYEDADGVIHFEHPLHSSAACGQMFKTKSLTNKRVNCPHCCTVADFYKKDVSRNEYQPKAKEK